MTTSLPHGILLIDKPTGITSFDVIRTLRKISGIRKFGHAGTLDPLASGLMLVGYEAGTKQLHTLTKLDKVYEAEILLGQARSTGDMEGAVLVEQSITEPVSKTTLTEVLETMIGALELPVSAYSAIKRDGTPLYRLAREAAAQGETVSDIPVRTMRILDAQCLHTAAIELDGKPLQLVTVRFAVGSGTYIRSLAEELGARLGYPATLYNLRRTHVGDFSLAAAYTLTDVEGIQKALGQ